MGPRPLDDGMEGGREGGQGRSFGGALMPGEVREGWRGGGMEGRKGRGMGY